MVGALIGIIFGLLLSNSASLFIYMLVKRVYLPITLDNGLVFSCVGMSILVGLLGGSLSYFMKRPGYEAYGVGIRL
jgi:hypothetical protein